MHTADQPLLPYSSTPPGKYAHVHSWELSTTAALCGLQTSLICPLMNEPWLFNEVFVFWELETYQQSDYSCVTIQASYWQAWQGHH